MLRSLLIVLIIALGVFPVAALAPSTDVLAELQGLTSRQPGTEVSWNDQGRVLAIYLPDASRGSSLTTLKDAEQLSRQFIAEHFVLFASSNPVNALRLSRSLRTGNDLHLDFQQVLAGRPVHGGIIRVHVSKNKVFAVENTLRHSALGVRVARGGGDIAAEDAEKIAMRDLNPGVLRMEPQVEPVVAERDMEAVLAWQVRIAAAKPLGDYEYLIASADGSIISREDYLMDLSNRDTTGSVYATNPNHGEPVALPIINQTIPQRLVGKWVKVINDDTEGALETEAGFHYRVGDTHFEEVMAYYHMNAVHDFFKDKFGFTSLDRSFPITVHYGDAYDNAFYSPWQGMIALGDGSKLNNLAREAGVIYHEYTHAVTGQIASMMGGEAGAMNEAFSDYFACTMTDDPLIGEWVMAKLNKPFMRNCDNNSHYPEDVQNEVHRDSPMYSGPLWKIRKALGAEKADRIIHFSRYFMPQRNAKFRDGLAATIAADRKHFEGANESVIVDAFAAHGIEKTTTTSPEAFRDLLRLRAAEGDSAATTLLEGLGE